MNRGELIYLACPYSHKDSEIMQNRFLAINKIAAKLMADGYYVFSPISHTHPIALAGTLPRGWEFWKGYDTVIIKNCKCVLVAMLDGWGTSTGVQAEIQIAKDLGIPVEYLDCK